MKRTTRLAEPRRVALLAVGRQELEQLLQLPHGMTIVATRDQFALGGLLVLVEGKELDPVDEAVEPPRLFGTWQYDSDTRRMRWIGAFPEDITDEEPR